PRNTVLNPQEDLKAITTQSGVTLAGPSVSPPPFSKKVDRETKTITDQVLTENTIRVPPPVVQSPPTPASSEIPLPLISSEPLKRNSHQPPIPYPSRLNKEKLQDKADVHKFFQKFKKLHFNISLAEPLALMPK
nr:hypothetical protein [Tanacetum cinerariifolium]